MAGVQGPVRLSRAYGSNGVEFELEAEPEAVLRFSCPHCHASLKGFLGCQECGAPMAAVTVGKTGLLHICRRRRCSARMVDLSPSAQATMRTLRRLHDEAATSEA